MSAKKYKVYLTLIGIGLAGMIGDRLMRKGGSPATAGAATVATQGAVAVPVSPDRFVPALEVTRMRFPNPGADLSELMSFRDPFKMPARVIEVLAPPDVPIGMLVDDESPEGSTHFLSNHRLSAILSVDGARVAVVDGLMVSVGQELDGCTLSAISDRSACFVCVDAEAVLLIDGTVAEGRRAN